MPSQLHQPSMTMKNEHRQPVGRFGSHLIKSFPIGIMSTSSNESSNAARTRLISRNLEGELRKNGPYILAGLGVSGGLLLLANRNIPNIQIPVLSSAADRVAYALRWTGLEGISMVTAIWCVIGVRTKYGDQPATTEGNANLEQTQRILSNNTESFLTFTAAKLALASVLDSNDLRLIPALSGLFILGRYSFDAAINSPARSFGYTINTVALFTTYGLFLYKLFNRGIHSNLLALSFR